jgi:L,D-transpeptidase ErfK/SrfK
MHILPAKTYEGVVLNIPERALYLFKAGRLAGRFPVAVGMKSWPTPTGRQEIHMMLKDPVWITPSEMVRREGAAPAALTVRSRSPLGDRWMGWCEVGPNESEVGFHGTNDVGSIGTLASHACVRLYPEHAREMFDQVYEGMMVNSLYEPIKIGTQSGIVYISVSPDIYGRKKNTIARMKQLLKQAGIRNPDMGRLKTILARQDGYPYRISP